MNIRSFKKTFAIVALLALLALPLMSASAQTSGPTASMVRQGFSTSSTGAEEIAVGGSVTYSIWLNDLPTGVTGAEVICTFNDTYVDLANAENLFLFGADEVVAVDQVTGKLTYAVASVPPNTAAASGGLFSFDLEGVAAGTFTFTCATRIAVGTTLSSVPFTPLTITVTEPSTNGTVFGSVLENTSVYDGTKTVNINLTDGGAVDEDQTVDLGIGGDFSFSVPAGTYTITASLSGYMDAVGTVVVVEGGSYEMSDLTMLAGDINGDDSIETLDVATIGANYNSATPTAADLNGSGLINLLDLQLLAPNYNIVGPFVWNLVP